MSLIIQNLGLELLVLIVVTNFLIWCTTQSYNDTKDIKISVGFLSLEVFTIVGAFGLLGLIGVLP